MLLDITTLEGSKDITNFKWRSAGGRKYNPSEMETKHLFYTIRMIWNNFMPNPVPDNPKFYVFGPTYTKPYMQDALISLGLELSKRKDIDDKFMKQILWMSDELKKYGEGSDKIRLHR